MSTSRLNEGVFRSYVSAVPSHFYRRRWDETRGDEFDSWGHSLWYFETDDEGWPIRQVELYDAGRVLRYGPRPLRTATAVSAKPAFTTQTRTGAPSKSRMSSSKGSGALTTSDGSPPATRGRR